MILEAAPLREGGWRELRCLHDTVQQHLRALKAMDYEPYGPFIISILELKPTLCLSGRSLVRIQPICHITSNCWNLSICRLKPLRHRYLNTRELHAMKIVQGKSLQPENLLQHLLPPQEFLQPMVSCPRLKNICSMHVVNSRLCLTRKWSLR